MKHPSTWLNDKLNGWPDQWLTFLLIAIAVMLVVIALKSNSLTKALVATWVLLP